MPSSNLTLLVRLGCHLCEDAAAMLAGAGLAFTRVDVDADPALREEYGLLVPVLLHAGRELAYPFTAADAAAFAR